MTETDNYYIPEYSSEGLYKEKGSKFLSYLYHVKSIEEVDVYLKAIKDQHPKSRHLCYAYRLSPSSGLYRINDDGEPSGTAGKPIYGQILSADLHEVLIGVIRYFGGTKLGASGLIRSYKTAAEDAINNTEKLLTFTARYVELNFDYAIMGDLMNSIKQLNLEPYEKTFDANPKIILQLKESESEHEIKRLLAHMLNRSIEDIEETTKIDGLNINWL